MERKLADVIYIFTSKDKPGIKFYDRSPEGAVAKFAGSLPSGKFETDIHSISEAMWDSKINKENSSQLMDIMEGEYVATTIMVSPTQMRKILETISQNKDESCIVIDVLENKNTNDKYIDIEQILQRELNNLDNTYDNYDSNKMEENTNRVIK